MNTKYSLRKKNISTLLWYLLFILSLSIWFIWQFHFTCLISTWDTFFHTQRIYEIRTAFLNKQLPSWVNFLTFHNSGQAINGMYPDLTLWPFILITNFLNPIHQILAIRTMIIFLTFLITFQSIKSRYDTNLAVKISIIYTLSGMSLRNAYLEFQPGSSLIIMILFPILFTFYDLLTTTHLDGKKIIQASLIMTFVLFSHLVSIFVLAIVVTIFALASLLKNKNIYPILNCIISSIILLITGSPIFYRYIVISKSGLLPPLGQGNTVGISLIKMVTESNWIGRTSFSIVSIIIIIALLLKFNSTKFIKMLPWIYTELLLIFFSSDIMPWTLLNNVPIFNQLQNAGWRFMIFSAAIPFILLLENYSYIPANKLLNCLVILSFSASFQLITNYQEQDLTILNSKTTQLIQHNQAVKMDSSGIISDKITRTLVPDYAPSQVKTLASSNHGVLSNYYQNVLQNKKAFLLQNGLPDKEIPYTITKVTNGYLSFNLKKQHGIIQLPVLGYQTLNYTIRDNQRRIPYRINSKGFLQIQLNNRTTGTISVEYKYPTFYLVTLSTSLISILLLLLNLILRNV